MVNKRSGKAAYAIMSFGGFLGMGESNYPLPWEALTYDTGLEGYVVNIDRDRLNQAPSYDEDTDPFVDPAYGRRVNEYWLS
jgi:hypothetical protein